MPKLFDNNKAKLLLNNILWLFFERGVRIAGGVIVGLWLARYLGAEQFGLLSYAISFVALFAPLNKLGIDSIAIRRIIEPNSKVPVIIGTSLIMKLCGTTLLITLALIVGNYIRPADPTFSLLIIILSTSYLFRSSDAFSTFFKAKMQNKYSVIAQNSAYCIALSVKVILILFGFSVVYFAITTLLEAIIAFALLLFLYLKTSGEKISNLQPSLSKARDLFRLGWPMMLASSFSTLFINIDKVMLGNFIGDQAVGHYAAAVTISMLTSFIPLAVINATFPLLSETRNTNHTKFITQIKYLLASLTVFSYITIFFTFLLSDQLITLFYGEQYAPAGPILAVHVIALLFFSIGLTRNAWTTINDIPKFTMLATAIGCLINIVLNSYLIPLYQGMGAAYATLISYIFAYFIINFFYSGTRQFFYYQIQSLLLITSLDILKHYRR
jgi:PST family polysaccharide transporter